MAELFPIGDIELWFAEGKDAEWRFPLYVQWKVDRETEKQYALITPAVCPYTSQGLVLRALLGTTDILGDSDRWLITRTMAERILHKAPGITPAAYYKWDDVHMPPMPAANPVKVATVKAPENRLDQGSSEYEDFVSHVCSKNGLPNSIVRVVMKAIASDAVTWMVENRKALDLGFCKLLTVPFRPNWKEIVAFKYRKWRLLGIFNMSRKEKAEKLEEIDMPSAMCSLHNIAINNKRGSNYTLQYTLEAIPGARFEADVWTVEKKRQACGTTSYVANFEKTIESLYHNLVDALEAYLRKTSKPFARISEGGKSGYLRFVPTSGLKVKIRGVLLRNLPVHIISPDSPFSVLGEKSDQLIVREKAAPVQALPIVPRGTNDLRECSEQGRLVQPGPEGANGVSLLHAGQGEDSRGPVLSISETAEPGSSRVDKGDGV